MTIESSSIYLYIFLVSDSKESNKPTSHTQEKKSTKGLAMTLCFLATAVIAIFALIIVFKWEKHERKIRPAYVNALRSSLRGKK